MAVVERQELVEACRGHRDAGRRIVFTNGCFDILHRGHVDYLSRAKALGDVLVVGLNTDRSVGELKGPCRPIVPEEDRAHVLDALSVVDYVVLFDEPTPLEVIEALQPDVLVKGAGYTRDTIVGADVVESRGGQVVALAPVPGRSTRSIIATILERGRGCLGGSR
ncbi:MAG: D-glycero-beta-D-manno-heptose 1-phosphate adenylyltransferase [Candidatus Eisenbacteria bacterium]|nr:D-glycero-beta-D-manno-heptose 1-phosphate adenylyltransferase [Candidatus Eisenbacteria bacterium]